MLGTDLILEASERIPASDSSNRERVHATEMSFAKQEAYRAVPGSGKEAATMLLKPNGAPIFAEELQRTEKKASGWEMDAETGKWL